MKFKFSFSILLLLINLNSIGQTYLDNAKIDTKISEHSELKNSLLIGAFLENDQYIVFRKAPIRGKGRWRYYLETIDNNLNTTKLLYLSGLTEIIETEKFEFEATRLIEDHIISFVSKKNKKTKKIETHYIILNTFSGKIEKRSLLHESKSKKAKEGFNYWCIDSPDHSKILVVIEEKFKNDSSVASFKVHDKDMQPLSEFNEIGFKLNELELIDFDVRNNGEILYLQNRIQDTVQSLELVRLLKNENKLNEIKLDNHNLMVARIVQHENRTVVTGLYYRSKSNVFEGTYLIDISNPDLEKPEIKTHIFNGIFLQHALYNRKKFFLEVRQPIEERTKSAFLVLDRILKHQDGSISVVGEMQWYNSTYGSRVGMTPGYSHTILHYGDYLISRFYPDGRVVDSHYPKDLMYSYSSAIYSHNNDVIIFHESKVKVQNPERVTNPQVDVKDSVTQKIIQVAKIREDGNVHSETLLNYDSEQFENIKPNRKLGYRIIKPRNETGVFLMPIEYYSGTSGILRIKM